MSSSKRLRQNNHGVVLPHDLILDIFGKLPVKSLLRFKCLSKQWFRQITDPRFIDFHLLKQRKKGLGFVTASYRSFRGWYGGPSEYRILDSMVVNRDTDSKTIPHSYRIITVPNEKCDEMLNSCDGILCFHGSSHAWLYNPATNEYRLLPPVFTLDPNPNARWKTIDEMPYKINATDSVYVNGAIYWFNLAEIIIMFDLYTEKFQAIPLLSSCSNELPIQRSMQLGTLRECLCLAERELDSQFLNIWIMEKQQQKITWEKLYCITFLRDYLWQIAGRIAFAEQKDGTLMVCTEDDVCWFKQNIEIPCMSHRFVTPEFNDSLVHSYFSNMNEAKCEPTVFTETLVPLYGRTMSQFKSLPETTAYFESRIYVVKPEAF
ncbi:hypothetical protein V6N13_090705 [Hibiscus sabdariffa]|uniref:F-box domain-containing protein n=1 Tax=Hibiscus sabdariffa TaxID=183260 RepID=A0ABR2NX44_9ROSI